ncbi:hypothetical protein GCM10027605_53640 [Micromonospora zhanjiangensis]
MLFGDDVSPPHPPGEGGRLLDRFPWQLGLDAMRTRVGATAGPG